MAFCDWLTIYQDHPEGGLPRINDGAVWAVNSDGEIEWTTDRKFEHVGSYDTKIRIMCDGYRVAVDGNIGRFGRPDNVFGYCVRDCIFKLNALLAGFGLPPFTSPLGLHNPNQGRTTVTTGAVITRVDITQNYCAGSARAAARLIHYMAGQDAGRRANVKQYGESGVSWNEGSKYWYSKLYVKGESLGDYADPSLSDWVKEQGIVRHEISLKTRYLAQKNLRHIWDWHEKDGQTMENIIYGKFAEVLTRGTAVEHPIEQIPGRVGLLANAWRSGKDLWNDQTVGQSTRRRWRKQLLPYGIDIKQPSNAVRLSTRVEVVKLQELEAPAWYWKQAA